MASDPITVSIPSPLAEKIRAAAEACGLTPNEWAELAVRRRMDEDRKMAGGAHKDDSDT